jgi:hypothetical protein
MSHVANALPTLLRSKGHGNGNANGSANKTTVNFMSNNSLIQVNTVTNPQTNHTGMSGTAVAAIAIGSLAAGAGIVWAAAKTTQDSKSSPSAMADSEAMAESARRRAQIEAILAKGAPT